MSIFVAYGLMPEYIPASPAFGSSDLMLENLNNCWSVGIKYYFLPADYQVRPRVSLHYGLNSVTEHQRVHETGKIMGTFKSWGEGYSIGVGLSWMPFFNKSLGIDFDLSYAITTEPYIASWDRLDEIYGEDGWKKFFPLIKEYPFYISLGIRYGFNIR